VLEEVAKRARGIPRLINLLCDNLLVTAFAMEQRTTTLDMLDEVCRDLRLEWGSGAHRRSRPRYNMDDEIPQTPYAVGD
jgi:hypothetical protein